MWKEFFIWEFRVVAKVYDNASQFGLSQFPRISKLSIWQNGKQLLNFDRGWDFNNLPDWMLEAILKAASKLLFLIQIMI
jgi:hypothetical protein